MRIPRVGLIALVMVCGSGIAALDPADGYHPLDTQARGQKPPAASEAVKQLELPEGFRATLFAGDSDVRQPIDMKIDDRGRVWVCEAYSYKEWKRKGADRILIFTDTDGDGVADQRKVFRGAFNHLSSVEIGFGGVWVLDTPHLLFFADKDGDDVPDGEPEILIEGWTDQGGHNVVNGLMWGIDGWLYGRHGITQPSIVGKPGAGKDERVFIEPGVWRFHPRIRKFEVVLRGMTNPWGLDWDERGEMFLSGNVNGHLWHGIPGALYDRMFGAGSVPHDYERLRMIGERPHYPSSGDWRQDWMRADKGRDATSELGGGHSHCGLMIYQGDNWPARFRGRLFMCNTHGRRVNIEEVAPQRSSFVGKHTGDVLVSKDKWFRGVNLVCGPDGGVFVADWCDDGECHDDDGVHRSSGRIYKLVYEGTDSQSPSAKSVRRRIDGSFDLAKHSDEELAAFTTDENEWFARHARRLLQERSLKPGRALSAPAIARVRTLAGDGPRVVHRLRALWTLHACELPMSDELMAASASGDEDVRASAVRLIVDDRSITDSEEARLIELARTDASPRVRLHLASALHRTPADFRWRFANALLVRSNDVDDNVLQLVLWHGIEPLVAAQAGESAGALRSCVFPKLRRFIARRLAAEFDRREVRGVLAALLSEAAAPGSAFAEDVLAGMRDGLRGRVGVAAPSNWPDLAARLLGHPSDVVREAALDLSIVFRDGATIDRLRQSVRDRTGPAVQRREALGGLIRARPDDLARLLDEAFADPTLRLVALRGFRTSAGEGTARRIVDAYAGLTAEEKQSAIDTLVSRAAFGRELLAAVSSGKVSRSDVTTTHAKLLLALDDSVVRKRLAEAWGTIATSDAARRAQIDEWKEKLSQPAEPGPDAAHGKAVFARVCAACHVLFGEGGRLGPDLTGSARKDLDYLVRNIVDPSATVPRDYQMTIVRMKDGEVLSGVVPREDEKTLTLQSIVETRVLDRTLISRVDRQLYSWMPEGLLSGLDEREVRDLVAYLQSESAVGAAASGGR